MIHPARGCGDNWASVQQARFRMRQHRRGERRHQAFGRKGVTWRGVVDLLALVG